MKSTASEADYAQAATGKRIGPVTSFEVASNTFDRAFDLTRRVLNLADRLCGSTVDNACDPSPPAREGVFGALDATARNVDNEIDRAIAALNRIEAELP